MMDATTDALRREPTPILIFFLKEAASEKAPEIDDYVRSRPLSLLIDKDEYSILLKAYPQTGEIELGIQCIARLWARAVAYEYVWSSMVEQLRKHSFATTFEIDEDHPALGLFDWSLACELNVTLEELTGLAEFNMIHAMELLPEDAKRLFTPDRADASLREVNRLWKYAMCYLMHHEFVHIRRTHESDGGFPSIEEEKAADREAAEWMLDAIDENSEEFFQRSQGVALALLWLASTEVHTGPLPSNTHPPGYDRLYQVLDQLIDNPKHPAWGFVALVLKLHFLAKDCGEIERTDFSSAKEEANYYIDLISRTWKD